MKIKEVETYTATIYIGTMANPGSRYKKSLMPSTAFKGREFCQKYCDEIGFCVSFTETEFIYSGDRERGLIIGIINYPRFPKSKADIYSHALVIASELKRIYKQKRCSIVFPDTTIMLGDDDG